MVVESLLGPDGMRQAEAFFCRAGVVIEPVTLEHGELARQAFLDFGKGRHKASLNFGDCFAYALAKATVEALLFQGPGFRVDRHQARMTTKPPTLPDDDQPGGIPLPAKLEPLVETRPSVRPCRDVEEHQPGVTPPTGATTALARPPGSRS